MSSYETRYKVLPFKGAQGDVPGHELIRHDHDFFGSKIERVILETFDQTAEMMIEIGIHWTKWTEWNKKKWPQGGSVKAVELENGRRIYAKTNICGHSDRGYDDAPILCRDAFAIITLGGGHRLIEIAGVRNWLYSKRDAEATAKHLACPWERDNRTFAERMARSGEEVTT